MGQVLPGLRTVTTVGLAMGNPGASCTEAGSCGWSRCKPQGVPGASCIASVVLGSAGMALAGWLEHLDHVPACAITVEGETNGALQCLPPGRVPVIPLL